MSRLILLPDRCDDRYLTMALDETLWRWVEAARLPSAIRFYDWAEKDVVTVGRFQALPSPLPQPFVRRISGGGAIRHRGLVTFAWAVERVAGQTGPELARQLHARVRRLLCERGYRAQLGGGGRSTQAFYCFERPDPTAVYVEGRRVMGSAQRWGRRAVLIHGVLALAPQLARAVLLAAIQELVGVSPQPSLWPPLLEGEARRLAERRYATVQWNLGRLPAGAVK